MQTNGFDQYEISNFCKPGQYSKHNSNYWQGVKYLGIGPSAHSFNGDTRQWNVANNAKYIKALPKTLSRRNRNPYRNQPPERVHHDLHPHHVGAGSYKLEHHRQRINRSVLKAARPYFDNGSISQKEQTIYLTPTGKLYADNIAAGLFF
jgi:oxygen-independent coproporphyrinogen-3 oxidase